MNKSLKIRQICFFYIAVLPVAKFFMMPSLISGIANEDCWISVLINGITDIFTVAVILFTLKDENCDFFTLVKQNFGNVFYKTVIIFYFIFFLAKTLLPVNEQKDYVELTLYMTSPTVFTFTPVFIAILYLSAQKLRMLGRIADAIAVISVLSYFLLFALSVPNTDITSLLPIGARGIGKISLASYNAQNWFGDGVYFLFFTGEYLKCKKGGLKVIISVIVSVLITVIFVILFYGTFGAIAFRQKFALTEISKYTTVVNNLERFDFLSVFGLLFTGIFSMCLPFFFATELLTRLINIKKPLAAIITSVLPILSVLFFDEYFASVQHFLVNYASGYFLFFGTVFPVIIAAILKIKSKKETNCEIQRN